MIDDASFDDEDTCISVFMGYVAVSMDHTKPAYGPYYCRDGATYHLLCRYVKEVLGDDFALISFQQDNDAFSDWSHKNTPW